MSGGKAGLSARESTKLPRATPAAKQVDPAGVAAFLDAVAAEHLELHSFVLFRGGAVVAEGFWKPYTPDRLHMQHSAVKSWTATAVGLALGEGRLTFDDKVVSFFPEHLPPVVSDHLAAMTVRDLLTMRTGHRTGISGGEWRAMKTSWIEAFLREPVEEKPGETFIYSSASSYMLSAIVSKVTGQTVHDYLEPRLFRPLGMGPIHWDLSPEGINTGGNGIRCTTEDVLKFGVLHLQQGRWNGREILPADWVREATRNHVAEVWLGPLDGKRFLRPQEITDKREGYGYQWWMTAHDGYRASGLYGQQCIVLPGRDTVIVFTGGLAAREPRLLQLVWKHLYPALGTRNSDAERREVALAAQLDSLALPEIEGASLVPLAAAIDGRCFRFAPNEDQVTEVALRFAGDRCSFTLADHRGVHRIEAGLGHTVEGDTTMTGNLLHHEYQPDLMRVLARGAWRDERTFVMSWRFIETAFCDTVVLQFDGDALRLDRSVNTNAGARTRPTLFGRAAH
jgi:CubicO group peptidase (beta-lactamase class C family)